MTLFLGEENVRMLLDMSIALEAVEESFRRQAAGDVWSQPRRRLELPGRSFLNDMTAADRKGGWMGAKLYTVARGKARFVVLLFRSETGELAALLEADFLGQMRTGAATGVATRFMSRPDARAIGLIGAGSQARTQLLAVSKVRKLDGVHVFSRDPQRRADFCREMSQRLDLPITPATSGEEAVRDADIVITATNSITPVLQGDWLAPGTHINAVGANLAVRRELDNDVVERAAVVAVDSREQAQMESGDLLQVFGKNGSEWNRVCELAEIVSGKIAGRGSEDEITLFKSNGIAAWDIAVAARVFERAQKEGVGQQISIGEG